MLLGVRVRFLTLGPVEVRADGREVNLGGAKPKTLLAALLLQPRRVVSIESLVALIWDDAPPQSATALVYTYASALRRSFSANGEPSLLTTRTPGYVLALTPDDSDLEVFQHRLDEARSAERSGDHVSAAQRYGQALELWRGPAFGGVRAEFARSRAASLEEDRLAAEEGLARCRLAQGRVTEATSRLIGLAAAHPLREETRGLLMRALYESGRQADALAAYRDGRKHLIDELGVEPGEKLRSLHSKILEGTLTPLAPAPVPAGAGQEVRAAVTAVGEQPAAPLAARLDHYVAPRHLPPDIGDFTGRVEQLEALIMLAGRDDTAFRTATPTVVVSGFGGVGKSALAVHAAHLLREHYPDGQLFADLRGSDRNITAHEVLGRFLGALGVTGPDLPEALDDRIELYRRKVADRRLLIVLDNASHEQQVRRLLPGSPRCFVIITSRSRLTGLEGAEPVELDFFSTEAAVDMLSSIVGEARVADDAESARTIARLCGGIPLAIRAAAARLLARPHWPLRSLADRLSDERRRLDELTVGDVAIRSSLRLNYADLDAPHRRAFHLLTLLDLPDFGSWLASPLLDIGPDDAEDVVEHLVDLRLLDVAGADALGRLRYRFHDLVQLFGAELALAGEPRQVIEAALDRAMAAWMALVEAGAKRLPRVTLGLRPSPSPTTALSPALLAEAENNPVEWLKSETPALVRAVERSHELGLDGASTTLITSLLSSPFAARNEFDGWQRTHEVALLAARKNQDRQAETILLAGLGQLFYEKDDFPAALDHFRQALELARAVGDAATQAIALVGIGTVRRDLGEFQDAADDLERAAGIAERVGDRSVVAAAHYGLGAIRRDGGDLEAAANSLSRCADIYREIGDPRGEAVSLRGLGLCHRARGEPHTAAELSNRAERILWAAGDALGAAYARQSLAKAMIRQGRGAEADPLLDSCLRVCVQHRDRFGVALVTRTKGESALARGELESARASLAEALGLWTELGLPLWRARTLRDLAAAQFPVDPEAAGNSWRTALGLFATARSRETAELDGLDPGAWLDQVRTGHRQAGG
ncbi:BTAD domain-containing putative transcriptional regulator [Streptomyces sp. ME19-01-6]|uniref:AfsR/SARP family transcriptional regulator n=1 Tax=Streptomyces sp. ME19-01-6 TaxID=3028686 RepID=UPI0029BCEF92|nr:BTAD domain-containing putative transcriptional regulator [Streptomyces sp. ME19-01-6]MDX3228523.1 BTAD domain-containing putative transcriptional regulator [Streptomyces sp. ME19-01-6]